jgi:hypothetical protein
LPLDQARNFSVFERQKIALSVGDRVRFTKNVKHRGQKFLNNELRTVVGIDEGKIIFDKGEIVCNGAALHIDQGIAVTSHASQAKTVDQVIVSMPLRSFSQANEAQFYVSMPRARRAMHLFTDSKVALRDAVTRPSRRLSSGLKVLDFYTGFCAHRATCLKADGKDITHLTLILNVDSNAEKGSRPSKKLELGQSADNNITRG